MKFMHIAGILLLGSLGAFAVVLSQAPCVCDNEWECACPEEAAILHEVREEDLARIPEPVRSEYRHFLEAWEQEYHSRNEAWAARYAAFQVEDRSDEESVAFDRQLRTERRDFVQVFRYRDQLFRQRLGIE